MNIHTSIKEQGWDEERLLASGEEFFDSLEDGINQAQKTIYFEVYIFSNDTLGRRMAKALCRAANRGVDVRVIVDGIGSRGWIYNLGIVLQQSGIHIKVYHQLPWERLFDFSKNNNSDNRTILSLFKLMNRRTHRKMFIIDDQFAWVGSMNVWDVTIGSCSDPPAWRELGIKVTGEGVKFFSAAFDYSWFSNPMRKSLEYISAQKKLKASLSSQVRLNTTFNLRRKIYQKMLSDIKKAKSRIYIANAYFIPRRSFLLALATAVKKGVDVKFIISTKSDIFLMPWISAAFYFALINIGVKVYGYKTSVMHAKYMLIDDMAVIGSTNLNQRSRLHDLEADVISFNTTTISKLYEEFNLDLSNSEQMSHMNFLRMPWWQKFLGRVALLLKYYL